MTYNKVHEATRRPLQRFVGPIQDQIKVVVIDAIRCAESIKSVVQQRKNMFRATKKIINEYTPLKIFLEQLVSDVDMMI